MTLPDRISRRLAALSIMAVITLMLPGVVAAHAELETSVPADGATVESPFDGPITMAFTEALADGSGADLLDGQGDTVAEATVDGPDAEMTFELDAALAPGEYEVRWVGVALDGHVERGTVSFTVAPAPPTASPSPTSTEVPTAAPTSTAAPATPSAEPAASASAEPSPTPDGSTANGDVILPIVVGLLVVLVGAAYLLSRRNRPMTPG